MEFRKPEIKENGKPLKKAKVIKGTSIEKALKAVEEAKKKGLDLSYIK